MKKLTASRRRELLGWGALSLAILVVMLGYTWITGGFEGTPPEPSEVLAGMDLPAPNPPGPAELTESVGGPASVATVCVDIDLDRKLDDLFAPTSREEERPIADVIAQALGLAGMEVVRTGCAARLDIEVTGSRPGASYTGVGFCATGLHIEGTTTLTVGATETVWPYEYELDPSHTIGPKCHVQSDQPIGPGAWTRPLVGLPLGEAWGDTGGAAAAIVGLLATDESLDLGEPTDETVSIAIVALQDPVLRKRAAQVLESLATDYPGHAALQTAVPYLIEASAADADYYSTYTHPLALITGESLDGDGNPRYPGWKAGKWYEWWIEQGRPGE